MARRLEDRVQVERGDAELLQVVELLGEALEVAAVEPAEDVVLVEGLSVATLPGAWRVPLARPRPRALGIVLGGAAAEAIDHDLVPDRVLRPVGRADRGRASVFERVDLGGACRHRAVLQDEHVASAAGRVGKRGFPPGEAIIVENLAHRDRIAALDEERRRLDVAAKGPQAQDLSAPAVGLPKDRKVRIVPHRDRLDRAVAAKAARRIRHEPRLGTQKQQRVEPAMTVRLAQIVARIVEPAVAAVGAACDELVAVRSVWQFDLGDPQAAEPPHRRRVGVPSVEVARKANPLCVLGTLEANEARPSAVRRTPRGHRCGNSRGVVEPRRRREHGDLGRKRRDRDGRDRRHGGRHDRGPHSSSPCGSHGAG